MSPVKGSVMKKVSAFVRNPETIGMGGSNPMARQNAQASKPENLLQQQQREQQPQQQNQRTTSRQAIADAAKANFITGKGRFGPPPAPPPPSGIPVSPRHADTHPPVDGGQQKRHGGGLWEESTIGSLLDESLGDGNNADVKQSAPIRSSYHDAANVPPKPRVDTENALFTVTHDGRFTVADESRRDTLAAGVNSALSQGKYSSPKLAHAGPAHINQRHTSDNLDIHQPQPRSLARTKLSLRERESKRASYVERTTTITGYPPGYDVMGMTSSKPVPQSATTPFNDGATKALEQKRSTLFQLTDDDMVDADDTAEDDNERTPRANRSHAPRTQQSPPKYGGTGLSSMGMGMGMGMGGGTDTGLGMGLQESSLPRGHHLTSTRDREQRINRKRKNMELDYEEGALRAMSYNNLRDEPFDYDPAVGNSPSRANSRSSSALPDRLEHYKNKGEEAQTDFFGALNVDDWETAGDWFLEQFGSLMGQLKTARQNKRKLCREFEDEIERRHQTVQTKMQIIDVTLGKMKSEGEIMMKDKELD